MIGADSGLVGLGVFFAVSFGTVLSATLAGYAHRNANAPAATAFRNLQAAAAGWGVAEVTIFLAPASFDWLELAYGVRFALSALTAILAILFLVSYTQSDLLDRRAVRGVLWGAFGAAMVLWVLNPGDLAYEALDVSTFQGITVVVPTFGPGLLVYFLFVYGFFVVALVVLGSFMLDSANLYRKQTGLIMLGFLVVIAGTLLYLLGHSPHQGLDFGPVLNAIGGVIIWAAIYRHGFLSVAPLATGTIVETIADPVLVTDEDNRLVYANESAAALGIREENREDPLDDLLADLEHAIETDTRYRYEPDGGTTRATRRVYEPRVQPVVDHHGLDRGHVIVLHDVTERERREQHLDEFASIVSHDLRNPLNVAQLRTSLALEETDTEHVEAIEESLDRMERLIEDLLTIAREGREELERQELPLDSLARNAWDNVRTDGITLDVESADTVVANRGQAMELFENLFRNAEEHNEPPVTVRVGSQPGGFYVADDGSGVDETVREELFDPGFTTANDGTGLGLYIVRRIAEAENWEVRVDESAGGGLRFDVVTDPDAV